MVVVKDTDNKIFIVHIAFLVKPAIILVDISYKT